MVVENYAVSLVIHYVNITVSCSGDNVCNCRQSIKRGWVGTCGDDEPTGGHAQSNGRAEHCCWQGQARPRIWHPSPQLSESVHTGGLPLAPLLTLSTQPTSPWKTPSFLATSFPRAAMSFWAGWVLAGTQTSGMLLSNSGQSDTWWWTSMWFSPSWTLGSSRSAQVGGDAQGCHLAAPLQWCSSQGFCKGSHGPSLLAFVQSSSRNPLQVSH